MKVLSTALALTIVFGAQTAFAAQTDLLTQAQSQIEALHAVCDGGDLSAPVAELTRIAGTLDAADANDAQLLELVSAGLNYASTVCAVLPQLNAAAHKTTL